MLSQPGEGGPEGTRSFKVMSPGTNWAWLMNNRAGLTRQLSNTRNSSISGRMPTQAYLRSKMPASA